MTCYTSFLCNERQKIVKNVFLKTQESSSYFSSQIFSQSFEINIRHKTTKSCQERSLVYVK